MKKKFLLIIIIMIIIITITALAFLLKKKSPANNTEPSPVSIIVPKLDRKYEMIDVCVDENDSDCQEKSTRYYWLDEYNNNPDLKPIIDQINTFYVDRAAEYKETKDSFDACPEKSKIYIHRYIEEGMISYFANDSLANITQDLLTLDVCTDKVAVSVFNTYYYNVEKQKLIDEDAFLSLLNLNRDKVDNKIVEYLKEKNLVKDEADYKKLISSNKMNCHVYLNMVGDMYARCIYDGNNFEDIDIYDNLEIGLKLNFE